MDNPIVVETDPYKEFYAALKTLREEFHRIGTFDDANAKLDEVCKLLVLKALDARHPNHSQSSRLSRVYLESVALNKFGDKTRLAAAIHAVCGEMAERFPEELNSFGPRLGLNMSLEDDSFAGALLPLLEAFPGDEPTKTKHWTFDGLNEAFGHFIQDSFRNRKEDAQYMTPPEVVSAVVDMAIGDILRDLAGAVPPAPLLVADPTCGVGSFLAAMYRHALHSPCGKGNLADHLEFLGQDKVERMVRLAQVNMKIFAGTSATIRLGNSIVPTSSLGDLQEKIDLILTNPPFGATFSTQELLENSNRDDLPALHALGREQKLPKTLNSEYILLDRELALLKPGGRLLMVVPDHVVSSGGFAEAFRRKMQHFSNLIAVVNLPVETFAQAGTRTKASVIYLQRKRDHVRETTKHIFVAISRDLGFRVVSRAGATVKRIVGPNDMERLADIYHKFRQASPPAGELVCLSGEPSAAAVMTNHLLNNSWNAGFFQSARLEALRRIELACQGDFTPWRLVDLMESGSKSREKIHADADNRCISVLHVGEDGCIDLKGVETYRPTTPATRCHEGDILLSKINPRIPRSCVVPDTPWKLGCSNEFAVIRPKVGLLDAWELLLLLRSELVQAQLTTLTTGTSSSHNRVKDRDLASILIPVPIPGTAAANKLTETAELFKNAVADHYSAARSIQESHVRVALLYQAQPGSK